MVRDRVCAVKWRAWQLFGSETSACADQVVILYDLGHVMGRRCAIQKTTRLKLMRES